MKNSTAKIVGLVSMIAGLAFIVAGGVAWGVVTSNLTAQQITVADDSPMLPGDDVNGPFSAYAQAQIIDTHALKISEGRTYADLGALVNQAKDAGDTELADTLQGQRNTVMNASFLRSSLFTAVLSYGVSALVMGLGVMFIVVGLGFRAVSGTAAPAAPVRERVNA
ncbi:MAG: aromatic ring-opening dioxygenase LigA [Georgenia sp.]